MLMRATFLVAFVSALWLIVMPSMGGVAWSPAGDGPGAGTLVAIVLAVGGFLGSRLRG